ncbi:MAG: glycosyltransferase family 4 protein [Candidatus Latescibacterota bacterium]|nr:MAG: glycosyltransferase family 4 protein [Candidatus Latescibacterota bacterium]
MKIVLVTQSYYPRPGGVTEHVHHSAIGLRRLGHDVTIVTSRFDYGHKETPGVVRVGRNVLVPINGAWVNMTVGIKLARDLRRVFDRIQPDVIHTHCPMAPTLPLLTLHVAPDNCRIVGTYHAAAKRNFAYWLFKPYLRRMARRLDTRIAVSETARELANKYVPGDFEIIPNGVDCSRFSPANKPLDHLRDDRFNILYAGRLDKRKGLKYLFRALAIVEKHTRRRLRLIVVGDDGPRRRLLPKLPTSVELHYAGVVPAELLPRYFASGHLFCAPAIESESFGIVLVEAMASGIPVVGTSIPGYLAILKHRSNALVVPPRDPRGLATAITELIDDDVLRERIRHNALEFVTAYSWNGIVTQLEAVYDGGKPAAMDSNEEHSAVLQNPIQVQKA